MEHKQMFRDETDIAIIFYTQKGYEIKVDIAEPFMPIYVVLKHKTEDKAVYINISYTNTTCELLAIECSGANYGYQEFHWDKQTIKQLAYFELV